jgi:hypothetical protein
MCLLREALRGRRFGEEVQEAVRKKTTTEQPKAFFSVGIRKPLNRYKNVWNCSENTLKNGVT